MRRCGLLAWLSRNSRYGRFPNALSQSNVLDGSLNSGYVTTAPRGAADLGQRGNTAVLTLHILHARRGARPSLSLGCRFRACQVQIR